MLPGMTGGSTLDSHTSTLAMVVVACSTTVAFNLIGFTFVCLGLTLFLDGTLPCTKGADCLPAKAT